MTRFENEMISQCLTEYSELLKTQAGTLLHYDKSGAMTMFDKAHAVSVLSEKIHGSNILRRSTDK